MGLFKGIEDAQATEGRNYLNEGTYDVELLKATVGETRKKIGFFAVDMKINGSNNALHAPDSMANWITMSDKDGFQSNVKSLVMAVLANDLPVGTVIDPHDITESVIEEMLKDDPKTHKNAFVGQKLRVVVMKKPTTTGGTYSLHTWFPLTARAA